MTLAMTIVDRMTHNELENHLRMIEFERRNVWNQYLSMYRRNRSLQDEITRLEQEYQIETTSENSTEDMYFEECEAEGRKYLELTVRDLANMNLEEMSEGKLRKQIIIWEKSRRTAWVELSEVNCENSKLTTRLLQLVEAERQKKNSYAYCGVDATTPVL